MCFERFKIVEFDKKREIDREGDTFLEVMFIFKKNAKEFWVFANRELRTKKAFYYIKKYGMIISMQMKKGKSGNSSTMNYGSKMVG